MSEASPSASPAGRARRAPRACESSRADLRSFASSVHRALTELDDPVDIASARSRSRARRIGPSSRDPIDILSPDARRKRPKLRARIAARLFVILLIAFTRPDSNPPPNSPRSRPLLCPSKILEVLFRHPRPLAILKVSACASSLHSCCSGRPRRLGRSKNAAEPVVARSRNAPKFNFHFSHLRWLLPDAQPTPPSRRGSLLAHRVDSGGSARAHRKIPQPAPSPSPLPPYRELPTLPARVVARGNMNRSTSATRPESCCLWCRRGGNELGEAVGGNRVHIFGSRFWVRGRWGTRIKEFSALDNLKSTNQIATSRGHLSGQTK